MKTYDEVILLTNYGTTAATPDWSLEAFASDEGYRLEGMDFWPHTKEAVVKLLVESGWEKICDMAEGGWDGGEVWGKQKDQAQ